MTKFPVFKLTAILIILMSLCACARSQQANYYILRSIQNPGPLAGAQDPAIGIGPLKIPDYLDRPQMVTRTSGSSIKLAEFDRWAEPLEKNLTHVLADNLSVLIPSEHVRVFPWPKSMPVQYQVTMEIMHLEKMPDGKVILDAQWNILGDNGKKLLLTKRTKLVQPLDSEGFEGIVSAESRTVEILSREIAASIKSLPSEEALSNEPM